MFSDNEKKILNNRCDQIHDLVTAHHSIENKIEKVSQFNPDDLIKIAENPEKYSVRSTKEAKQKNAQRNDYQDKLDKILKQDMTSPDKLKRDTVDQWFHNNPDTLHRYAQFGDEQQKSSAHGFINQSTIDYTKQMNQSDDKGKVYKEASKYLPRKNMVNVMNHADLQAPDIPELNHYQQLNINKSIDDYGGSHEDHIKSGNSKQDMGRIEKDLLSNNKVDHARAYAWLAYTPNDRKTCKNSPDKFLNQASHKFSQQHQKVDYDMGSGDPRRTIKELLNRGQVKEYKLVKQQRHAMMKSHLQKQQQVKQNNAPSMN